MSKFLESNPMPLGIGATAKCRAPNQHRNNRLSCGGERAPTLRYHRSTTITALAPYRESASAQQTVPDESVSGEGYLCDIPNDA
jgi:hypothetical protein